MADQPDRTASSSAATEPELCPGTGGFYRDDGAMDRTPSDRWYDCELCGKTHENRRPRKWWYV